MWIAIGIFGGLNFVLTLVLYPSIRAEISNAWVLASLSLVLGVTSFTILHQLVVRLRGRSHGG